MAHQIPFPLTTAFRQGLFLLAAVLCLNPSQAQTGTIAVGYGNATSPYFPLHSCYTYNYSQQIYTADELTAAGGLAGNITALRFFHVAGADDEGTGWNNWTVYLGGTAQASFGGTSDWVPASGLQQVFNGTVAPVIGDWMEITLDTPFAWDGVQNVVVAVHENSPGFGCTAVWKAYDATVNRAMLFRSDLLDPDPAAPPAASTMPSSQLAQVEFIGTTAACMPPAAITATGITPASFQLAWTDNGATNYTYEVRSSGAPGSGPSGLFATGDATSGTPPTDIAGLVANTLFSAYVRSNCGGSSSNWGFPLMVQTPCDPVTVPYAEDFSAVTAPSLPSCFVAQQVTGVPWNTVASPMPGMDGNCAHAAYNLITLPDQWMFTAGINLQASTSYRINYLYGNGNTDASDRLNIYLSTGRSASDTVMLLAQHPDIATAIALAGQADFSPSTSGTYYLAFRYYALPGGNPSQIFVDNIQVDSLPACQPVTQVNASSTGPASGTVSWTAPANAPDGGYDLYYSTDPAAPTEATLPSITGILGTSQDLSALNPGQPVYCWVRSHCSDQNTSTWAGPAVLIPGLYQIGTGAGTDGSYPISSCHNYSYSQQLYLASEYSGGTVITHIRFKYLGGSSDPSAWAQWTVYMGNTSLSAFAGTSDWVPSSQLQQVYAGTVAPVTGEWMDLAFSAPFVWNGSDNMVIAVDENSDGASCTAQWASFMPGGARGLLYASDFSNPDPASPPAASQGPDFSIAQLQLFAEEPTPCNGMPAPGATTGPASICPGAAFTVALENNTAESGITYQWQTSTDGTNWNNAPGNSTAQAYAATQATDTWYRAEVTCNAAGSTTSAPLLVTTTPYTECYCQTITFSAQVEPICNVTFAGIDHSSPGTVDGSPALEDFTAEAPAEVDAGGTYPLSVTGNTNGNFTDQIAAFFDWDHDGVFEATVNLAAITNDNCISGSSGTVAVPSTAIAGLSRMRVVKNAGTAPADPCSPYSYGQAEDYFVNVTVPQPCDALPVPGSTNGPSSICPDAAFTLTVQNPSAQPGISFLWETSADGLTWANAPGIANQATYAATQTTPTWYRAQVSCANAGTAASSPLLVGINPPTDCYCTTLAFTYQVQPICHVDFGGISNSSNGTPGNLPALEDFTALAPAQVTAGFTYPLSVSGYSDITTSQVAAFFDWDQDGVFETSVPLGSITDAACTTTLTADIAVPASALPGLSRMRILLGDFQVPTDPCGTYISGQGEDYWVNVLVPAACDGQPEPGSTTGPTSSCPSVPFTLGISNTLQETGISYQWQSSLDGNTWADAPGNSDEATFNTSASADTWFRAEVNCDAGGTAYSTPLQVAMAPPSECYCTGIAFTSMVQPICHVTFAGLDHLSSGTLNSSPGLQDFTAFAASVYQGHNYPISVSGNTGGGAGYVSVFFDWDGNGVFETALNVGTLGDTACASPAVTNIVVPPAALPGLFHMRVVLNANNYATDACAQYAQGQAEDYSIQVLSAIGITELGQHPIRVSPNPAHTVLFLENRNGQPMDVQVHDLSGKLVLWQSQVRQVDVSRLAPGLYMLSIADRKGMPEAYVRFVKE
ncbi:MAG: T9SS type A sorting domain-containing protein [Bacteroidetes bacterium]|nr:T9SS type A sorting domain-containing protein [Bacteroidota bacterium]